MQQSSTNKKVKINYKIDQKQWVGDGFYVSPLLRPSKELNPYISPFILIDYAAPRTFKATTIPKGVPKHPHRGFETVTFAYQGEVEHKDSCGGGGVIKPGDVQWMTAGAGIIHSEFHSKNFCKEGGAFEMVQLWINLPKKMKMTNPKYQEIKNESIPVIKINNSLNLKLIAGSYKDKRGPSSTFTPINIYDITSQSTEEMRIKLQEKTNTIILILRGSLEIQEKRYQEQSVVIFEQEGEYLKFKTSSNFKALILNGEPINEPFVAHGPFVMNTQEEIYEAIEDYQNGKMGQI